MRPGCGKKCNDVDNLDGLNGNTGIRALMVCLLSPSTPYLGTMARTGTRFFTATRVTSITNLLYLPLHLFYHHCCYYHYCYYCHYRYYYCYHSHIAKASTTVIIIAITLFLLLRGLKGSSGLDVRPEENARRINGLLPLLFFHYNNPQRGLGISASGSRKVRDPFFVRFPVSGL